MKKVFIHISQTLKAARKERGWSLDKAAMETGVSKAMLGQIERGESSPTIAILWKIANGFQTSFSSLLGPIDPALIKSTTHSGQVTMQHPQDNKIQVLSLFPFDPQLRCEMFVIDLLPGCEHLSLAHKPGVIEHIIVVSGTIEVFLRGDWQKLSQNEGLRFHADKPHGYRNLSANMARFHDIIHYSA